MGVISRHSSRQRSLVATSCTDRGWATHGTLRSDSCRRERGVPRGARPPTRALGTMQAVSPSSGVPCEAMAPYLARSACLRRLQRGRDPGGAESLPVPMLVLSRRIDTDASKIAQERRSPTPTVGFRSLSVPRGRSDDRGLAKWTGPEPSLGPHGSVRCCVLVRAPWAGSCARSDTVWAIHPTRPISKMFVQVCSPVATYLPDWLSTHIPSTFLPVHRTIHLSTTTS